MLFALICNDKPNALQLRLDTRPAHLEWLNGLKDKGIVKLGGPFMDAEGKPDGSMVVIEAENQSAAEALAGQDPYARAGLFAAVEVRPWTWVINNPEA
ncbi:YciI-like protein [Zhengella sp. ZM62]|uniref:YciI-like protein n=1 Tax=Zhengella sedimenti TaxID=3390035 RepID=UPI00397511FE